MNSELRALPVALWGLFACACSGMLPSSPPAAATPAGDPTPLAKCQVRADASSPLVTEWPASEKAHLQSLATRQTVAVEYSGCELRIVDGCQLPGNYAWSRTTLATDTLEIQDADELYAKLPIGAIGLEGELQRSGRLAVRTTVAGQLRSEGMTLQAPEAPACAAATHYISAISIGAFQLLSGSEASGSASVDAGITGGAAKSSRKEVVLREAGTREACAEGSDAAPSSQCASPIQVFLTPISPKATARTSDAAPSKDSAVYVSFPPPEDSDEVWTLRGAGGKLLCTLPCGQWVGPVSGYYLQREERNGANAARLNLPGAFAHPVGSHVTADFQTERGNPGLARWTFYGGIFYAATGVGLTTWGIVEASNPCDEQEIGCHNIGGLLIGTGIFLMAAGSAGIWWHLWSREEKFVTYEDLSSSGQREGGVKVMVGPGSLYGTF
ncbi:MAG TPA: hypothetical protein VM686_31440 [Polyangiaceae bacterium]|nr:hypothetical protein [Polyangiaceae bacterium]